MRPTPVPQLARRARLLLLAAAALALAGCPNVPPQTAAMREAENVDVSADLLQLRNYETARRVNALIVLAADTIAARNPEPSAQIRALQWKVSAIPLFQDASLRDDPLVSAVDLAELSIQQVDYFTTGDGRDAFGAQQQVAVRASRAAEDLVFADMARSTKSGWLKPETKDTLVAWAARHPIHGADMQRPSLLGSDWSMVGLSNSSLGATAGNIDRTLRLVTLRMSFLNETMGAQLRWSADLTMWHALATPRGDTLVVQSAGAVRDVGVMANEFPATLSREVANVVAGLDRERVLLMKDVDRQRLAATEDLRAERVALEAMVARERAAVMENVKAERIAIMHSADSVAQRTVEHSEHAASRLVVEVLLAALVAITALVAGGVFLMNRWRRSAPLRGAGG